MTIDPNARPLGLSPDGHRVVRVGFDEDGSKRELVVTDVETSTTTSVPIDAAATRLGAVSALDPAWLAHYYAWVRGSDGSHALQARPHVTPLPYKGVLVPPDHGYREYHITPAGEAMYKALIEFLTSEMGATRTAEDMAAYGSSNRCHS